MKRIFPILIAALCIACFALPVFGCAPSENDDGDGGDTMTEEEYQHYGAYSYYYYPQLGRDVMPGRRMVRASYSELRQFRQSELYHRRKL